MAQKIDGLNAVKQYLYAAMRKKAEASWQKIANELAGFGSQPEIVAQLFAEFYFPLTSVLKHFIAVRICNAAEHSCWLRFSQCPGQLGEEIACDVALTVLKQVGERFVGSRDAGLSNYEALLNYLCQRAAGEVLTVVSRQCRKRQQQTELPHHEKALQIDAAANERTEELVDLIANMMEELQLRLRGALYIHLEKLRILCQQQYPENSIESQGLHLLAVVFSGRHVDLSFRAEIIFYCCQTINTFHTHQLRLRVRAQEEFPVLAKLRQGRMGGDMV